MAEFASYGLPIVGIVVLFAFSAGWNFGLKQALGSLDEREMLGEIKRRRIADKKMAEIRAEVNKEVEAEVDIYKS